MKGKQLVATLLRVAWKAFIYYIWKERNGRLYGQIMETPMQVFEHIKEAVCIRLAGLPKVGVMHTNRQLCTSWGLVDV